MTNLPFPGEGLVYVSWTSQIPTPLISNANEMEPTTDEPDYRYQKKLAQLLNAESRYLLTYSSLKLVSSSSNSFHAHFNQPNK